MHRPPLGVCLPVQIVTVHDGDTVTIRVAIDPEEPALWRIRLLDCWAPELSTQAGIEARQFAEKLCAQAANPAVFVPFTDEMIAAIRRTHNWLAAICTFDRILGYVFLSPTVSLNEAMVDAGHAKKTKNAELHRLPEPPKERIPATGIHDIEPATPAS